MNTQYSQKYNIGDMFVYVDDHGSEKAVITIIGKGTIPEFADVQQEFYVYQHHYINTKNNTNHIANYFSDDDGFDCRINKDKYSYYPVVK